ncbi:MAG: Membrane protein containing DUF205 [uncultured bacterium]|nr:MAG: Membrane protein containing DUF205 [uncultured bacterium]
MLVEIMLAVMIAYLFGSISSAIITCKLMGMPDPRKQGSGNPGATNVLRMGGKKAAIITLLGDIIKGVIPVLAAKIVGIHTFGLSLVAFAAFFGHLYPIFFRFQGGKGVATAFGALTALSWPVGLSLALSWLLIAFIFRYSSLASLIAALLAPFYMGYFTLNQSYVTMTIVMSLFLIYRHKNNIRHLWQGKESKIGKSK